MQPPLIDVQQLNKRYGKLDALRDVSFSVPAGAFVTLFGPNGSGKTTLIRILANLIHPTSGDARIAGRSLARDGAQTRTLLGVVLHQSLLYDALTAQENLQFYGRMFNVPLLQKRIEWLLDDVGLYDRRADLVRTFSRGMQQRLSIARALLHDPKILLLDEAFSGLDANAVNALRRMLARFHDEGRTILMSTHEYKLGMQQATHVAMLVNGALRYFGAPEGMATLLAHKETERHEHDDLYDI